MGTESGNSSPSPPDPPNISPGGKWGVAPSASPQTTRTADRFKCAYGLWWTPANPIVLAIVVVTLAVA